MFIVIVSYKPVKLLDLPFDIRSKILGYLFSDTRYIVYRAVGLKRYRDRLILDKPMRIAPVPYWWIFDYKAASLYSKVLLTNRQLYEDGFHYLYEIQNFTLVVNLSRIGFPKRNIPPFR